MKLAFFIFWGQYYMFSHRIRLIRLPPIWSPFKPLFCHTCVLNTWYNITEYEWNKDINTFLYYKFKCWNSKCLNVKTSYQKRPILHVIPFWEIIETYLTMQQNISNCSQIKQWKIYFGDSLNCVSNVKKVSNWDQIETFCPRHIWD